MFFHFPWYTQLALWLLGSLVALLAWGLRVTWRGMLLAHTLRLCTRLMQTLTRGCLAFTQGKLGVGLGTAHWATHHEIARAGLLRPGTLPLGLSKGQTLYEPSGGHVLVLGPPRSRKSWGIVMPTLRRWQGNVIVTDLRDYMDPDTHTITIGELWTKTHEERARFGPVWKFSPTEPDSCNLDVLSAIRWDTPNAFGDAHRLVHHLLQPSRDQKTAGFEKSAVPLLTGIVLYCHTLGGTYAEGFPGVVQWMLSPDKALTEKLEDMLTNPNLIISGAARRALDESVNLRSVVWNACLEPLAIFQDEMIAAHTRSNDLDWPALLTSINPQSLYLCCPFSEIARFGPFLGCFVEMLVSLVGSPTVFPRHRNLLLLDEAANLGFLDSLEKAVSYLQGSGTQLLAIFQNMPQVLQTYGPNSPLWASIATTVAYTPTPNDAMTATWLSGQLGQATTWALSLGGSMSDSHTTSTGVSGGLGLSTSSVGLNLGGQMGWSDSTGQGGSVGQMQTVRPLLTPDEVRRIPADTAIVLTQGTAPIWAKKFPMPGTTVQRFAWQRLRKPVLVTAGVLVLVSAVCWPVVSRVRLALWAHHERQEHPVRPWERDTPIVPPGVHPQLDGKPFTLCNMMQGSDWTTNPFWQQRCAQEAKQYSDHPRSEEDLALGRKPKSLLAQEQLRAIKALFPPPVPPYKGSWYFQHADPYWVDRNTAPWGDMVATLTLPDHAAMRDHVTTQHPREWLLLGEYPTADECQKAMHERTDPLIAMDEAFKAQYPEVRFEVKRHPDIVSWAKWEKTDRPTKNQVQRYRCVHRPYALAYDPTLPYGRPYTVWTVQLGNPFSAFHQEGHGPAHGLFFTQHECERELLRLTPPTTQWQDMIKDIPGTAENRWDKLPDGTPIYRVGSNRQRHFKFGKLSPGHFAWCHPPQRSARATRIEYAPDCDWCED